MSIYFIIFNRRRKKRNQILPLVAFHNIYFKLLFFPHFSVRVVGAHQTLLPVLLSECDKCASTTATYYTNFQCEVPSDDHDNTDRLQRKHVVTRKR
jgi:predicted membrane protein